MAKQRIISADSHVNPPKDLWTRDAPERLEDRVPRVESTPQGDFWVVDSEITGGIGLDAAAGRTPEQFKAVGLAYKACCSHAVWLSGWLARLRPAEGTRSAIRSSARESLPGRSARRR